MSRLIAVEPFPRLSRVLNGEEHTDSFPGQTTLLSIAGKHLKNQAFGPLARSNGLAVNVSD
ncbi:hypothetical protein NDK47_11190 [Brevibacillus ruminantium]|uniref:Uncharacterized protein n=1 Tax=Brevibacillus ruminantium TaxID=2950604 RepID=A0ABY4WKZ7_9BACL|nr:hypothetical protein [Brevibacillus ruminantium]USG67797.1 hypothetical protein NDK47_11190 [Brevibacillus ruminantium]